MHEGEGKIWYAIPYYHREKFERLAKEKLAILFDEDPNLLLNINVMINPAYLVENGVHVYRTLQKPGEIILTFPESYHQGVSVGFNVAEAVNMACPSWMDYGVKAMDIYMQTKEKVPVFPLEWILIENSRYINELDFDIDNMKLIRDHYKSWLQKELTERSLLSSHFSNEVIYKSKWVQALKDRDNVEEDAFECFYWISLCYASFIEWSNCNKHYWIGHEIMCGWNKESIKAIYRYSNEELNLFLDNINERINQLEE